MPFRLEDAFVDLIVTVSKADHHKCGWISQLAQDQMPRCLEGDGVKALDFALL